MTLQVLSKFLMSAPLALLWLSQNPPPATKPPATNPSVTQPSLVKPAPPKQPPATPAPPTLPPEAAALPPETVILTVGDQKITKAEFEALLEGLPEQARRTATGPNRRKMAEDLAQLKAMAQEAKRRKLDQSASVRQVLELQQEQVLASTLVKQLQASTKTDDAAVKEWYDAHKGEYENVKASHILTRFKGSSVPLKKDQKELSEEEALAKAQEIRKKLLAGEDFAKLAKAESDDAGSAANGGSLGAITKGRMVPAFEQAAFTLKVGELSEPVKTQFGYHVIKVEEHTTKTLDQMRAQIEQQMKPQMTQKAIDNIRIGAQVVINEQYFGPGPAPAAK
jgi:peptidyl-prolyl cis-trans isomerase C